MNVKLLPLGIVFLVFLNSISGCSVLEIQEEIDQAESVGVIKGKIIRVSTKQGPVIIHRFFLDKTTFITDSNVRATAGGEYDFNSLPGTYYLSAFIDSNKDGEYQENEDFDYLRLDSGTPEPIIVEPGKTVSVKDIIITGNRPKVPDGYISKETKAKITQSTGKLIQLDDPIFIQDNYSMGMWEPIRFLKQVGGGLFFLEEYQANKIPVLFVHGINGGPLDWKEIIDGLDHEKFQPWIIYYPSGFRLHLISHYLVQEIVRLQDRYDFKQIIVAAHSMGGLLARSFIKKYRQKYPLHSESIRLLITVNSPLEGMDSALLGVERSPIVLPVWRDLAPGSDFLQDLNTWPWPNDIPYHLVFSYVDGSSSDSIVDLKSQIPLKIQRETVKMYGFINTHVGTLTDENFVTLFHSILADNLDQ